MAPAAEAPPGTVTARANGAELVVGISGEVAICQRKQLARLAGRLAGCDVVVDLSEVTFCDATLAGFLAEALSRAPVTIEAPTRLTREFLALYGVDRDHRTVQHKTNEDCQ